MGHLGVSVKRLTLAGVVISGSWDQAQVPRLVGSLLVPLPLPPPHAHSLSLK